jgi:hypothetical protein
MLAICCQLLASGKLHARFIMSPKALRTSDCRFARLVWIRHTGFVWFFIWTSLVGIPVSLLVFVWCRAGISDEVPIRVGVKRFRGKADTSHDATEVVTGVRLCNRPLLVLRVISRARNDQIAFR